jgi:hypothetical protein
LIGESCGKRLLEGGLREGIGGDLPGLVLPEEVILFGDWAADTRFLFTTVDKRSSRG